MNGPVRPIDPIGRRLGSLELGRALAALAVVAHHAGQASDGFTSDHHGYLFNFGIYGVDFFFVLSGFIIYHVHQTDPKTMAAARRFLKRRLRRIYVPYLPIVILLIVAYQSFPGLSQGNREWGWFTSLTLIPTGSPPALSVAWTLVFEMTFYLTFLILFYMTVHFWWYVIGWAFLTIVIWATVKSDTLYTPFSAMFDPLILEFISGMVMAYVLGRVSPPRWVLVLAISLVAVVLFFLAGEAHRVFMGFAMAPLVLGIALAERRFGFRMPAWALLFGSASYAIYLMHNPVQSVVARILSGPDMWILTFLACCLAGTVAGLLYHTLFERPVLRLLGRHSLQTNQPAT